VWSLVFLDIKEKKKLKKKKSKNSGLTTPGEIMEKGVAWVVLILETQYL